MVRAPVSNSRLATSGSATAGGEGSCIHIRGGSPLGRAVHVEGGAGGSLLGEVAQPDVFGTSLRHELGVNRACVDLLIERGSDLDGPLNLAACFDRLELVEILLAAGARVDVLGIHGVTPLETAIYHASRGWADVLAAIELAPDALGSLPGLAASTASSSSSTDTAD